MTAPILGSEMRVRDAVSSVDWPALTAGVNCWRGECLHHIAKAEAAVSEALLFFSRDPMTTVTLPHLVGSRYDELERLLVASEAEPQKAALLALRCFRKHDKLRIFLCHGVATVLAGRNGEWHLLLDLLAFRSGLAVRDELFLTRSKAMSRFDTLRVEGQKLSQKLAALATG